MEISFNTKKQHNSNIQCNNSRKQNGLLKIQHYTHTLDVKKKKKIFKKDTLHFKVEFNKHNSNIQCNKSMN